jgi:putative Holliday junction resolvase
MSATEKTHINRRVIALDYGRVHTGAAVSDPTGTIVRPLPEVSAAVSEAGMEAIVRLVDTEDAQLVVVGMPVSLSGEMGEQAQETARFIEQLTQRLAVPVLSWDERFTSKIARERGRGATANEHSIAASCLLEDFLASDEFRRQIQNRPA